MGKVEEYLPVMAMVGLQISYAVMALISRAALLTGMIPTVFVVYRQAAATLFIAPIAYFSRPKSRRLSLNFNSFSLIFLAAFVGFISQLVNGSTMSNLTPALTFFIAAIFGMESVKMGNLRSMAKVGGTVVCVSGAMCMALLRGPKLLNYSTQHFGLKSSIFDVEIGSNTAWLLGCLCLFGSSCCWSTWLILQVPAMAIYPDKLSLSAWMCFFSLIQSSIVTLLTEPFNLQTWKIHSSFELFCYLFSGIFGSGISYFVQAWCISKRGPVFSAVFSPFYTIVTTILAAIFLHEEIYIGSLLGGVAVIIGLYTVLWGKAKDYNVKEESTERQSFEQQEENCESLSTDAHNSKIDLEKSLLTK